MYFAYILECRDGTLYAGITTDVARRFTEHKKGIGGSYTRSRGARKIVHTEKCGTRSAALKREAEIKRMTRSQKIKLIRSGH